MRVLYRAERDGYIGRTASGRDAVTEIDDRDAEIAPALAAPRGGRLPVIAAALLVILLLASTVGLRRYFSLPKPQANVRPVAFELRLARNHDRSRVHFGAEDLAHIAEICRTVEGLPLAILLAASWSRMMTAARDRARTCPRSRPRA